MILMFYFLQVFKYIIVFGCFLPYGNILINISLYLLQTEHSKKMRGDDGLGEDLNNVTMESGAASPAQSELSMNSSQLFTSGLGGDISIGGLSHINDDSSNEALIVDCDSPNRDSTPGKWKLVLIYKVRETGEEIFREDSLSLPRGYSIHL